jgi:catechol 2,3-dioxygenase-like lactoylglutathione lyase family enzyme
MLGANDIEESKKFYDAILATMGYRPGVIDEKGSCFYMDKKGVFALSKPIDGEKACHANGGTIGFAAESTDMADAWHKAGLANGGTDCEEPPGLRTRTIGELYLAYLRDPSGNKVCALHKLG